MMETRQIDIAVFGSTPLARLSAGLLAETHHRRVALIGESSAAYRLARGLDLSVAPLTRPETWALLAETVPETLRLLARIGGKAGYQHVDPVITTATAHGRQALAHVRHMASGFGHDTQVAPEGLAGVAREGLILRDAALMLRGELEPVLDDWLERLGVPILPARRCRTEMDATGATRIVVGDMRVEAALAILADDEAVLMHAPAALDGHLVARAATALLTEPCTALPWPVLIDLDGATQLWQAPSSAVVAIATNSPPEAIAATGALLAHHGPLRLAGEVGFRQLIPHDGAPVLGRPAADAPVVLAGLGMTGAFQAPALARWIAGAASGIEEAYFAARGFAREPAGSTVAEVPTGAAALEVGA